MADDPVFPIDTRGGCYELALELGPRSDAHLMASFKAMWNYPLLEGCYLDRTKTRAEQAKLIPASIPEMDQPLYGVARIDGKELGCYSNTIREDDGPDWLCLNFSMAVLEEHFPVDGYPFGDVSKSSVWEKPLGDWLAKLGEHIFKQCPFELGLVGHEASGMDYARNWKSSGPPQSRSLGYLWPSNERLLWLAANK